jgi:hypothetical protein
MIKGKKNRDANQLHTTTEAMQEAFSCPPPLPVGAPRSEDASGGEEVGVATNDLGPQLDSAWWTRTGSSLALSALPGAAPPCAVVNGCSNSATQCFVKALELDSTSAKAWSSLGLTLVKHPPESPVLVYGVAYRSISPSPNRRLR